MHTATIDHLIVMAATLDEGVAWCEAALGITPGPGGEHAFMGTHNRLFSVATAEHPAAYFEIIAINPVANNAHITCRNRWFDMDSEALRASVAASGPRLIHWVARVPALGPSLGALQSMGVDRGHAVQASRPTAHGLLQWQISIREDGQRLFDGCLPTLIEWGDRHPTDHMPASGVSLAGLHIRHPDAQALNPALLAMGLNVKAEAGPPCLAVDLNTPKGLIRLTTS